MASSRDCAPAFLSGLGDSYCAVVALTFFLSVISMSENQDPNMSYKVEVSYMEIYNEKVISLLPPRPAALAH